MKNDQDFFEHQFFVCTNKRANGQDCASKGAEKLRDSLKAHFKGFKNPDGSAPRLRINASGCLGRCEEGIACVLYPSGEWFVDVVVDVADGIKGGDLGADQTKLIAAIESKLKPA